MPTRRMIDPAIWQSESVARLTYRQRLLFIGLFSNADDQGRLRGHPSLIRSTVFPYDDIPIEEIEADLSAIAAADSIFIYQAEGTRYIQITNWWQYQTPQWAYPSRICPPQGWQDKLRYRQNNEVHTENWDNQGGFIKESNQNDGEGSGNGVGQSLPEIGKDLAEPLPKDLGGPIELVVESELESDSTTTINAHACENLKLITKRYTSAITTTFSPRMADEFKDYAGQCRDPAWIDYAFDQAEDANVRKWNYVRTILDSCIAAGNIPPKPKKANGRHHDKRRTKNAGTDEQATARAAAITQRERLDQARAAI